MLTELEGFDWAEVFGEGTGGNCDPIDPIGLPDNSVDTSRFAREDVVLIKGQLAGENDEQDWIVWGQLKDSRWFVARGWCDYTGWDCRAGNSGNVAISSNDLIRYGMTAGERERFGVSWEGHNAQED